MNGVRVNYFVSWRMYRVKCRYFAANFGSIFFNLCLNFAS